MIILGILRLIWILHIYNIVLHLFLDCLDLLISDKWLQFYLLLGILNLSILSFFILHPILFKKLRRILCKSLKLLPSSFIIAKPFNQKLNLLNILAINFYIFCTVTQHFLHNIKFFFWTRRLTRSCRFFLNLLFIFVYFIIGFLDPFVHVFGWTFLFIFYALSCLLL